MNYKRHYLKLIKTKKRDTVTDLELKQIIINEAANATSIKEFTGRYVELVKQQYPNVEIYVSITSDIFIKDTNNFYNKKYSGKAYSFTIDGYTKTRDRDFDLSKLFWAFGQFKPDFIECALYSKTVKEYKEKNKFVIKYENYPIFYAIEAFPLILSETELIDSFKIRYSNIIKTLRKKYQYEINKFIENTDEYRNIASKLQELEIALNKLNQLLTECTNTKKNLEEELQSKFILNHIDKSIKLKDMPINLDKEELSFLNKFNILDLTKTKKEFNKLTDEFNKLKEEHPEIFI